MPIWLYRDVWVESDSVTLNGTYIVSSFLDGLHLFVVDGVTAIL